MTSDAQSQPGPSQDSIVIGSTPAPPDGFEERDRRNKRRRIQLEEEELDLRQRELNQRRAALDATTLLPRSTTDDEDDPRKYPQAIQECGDLFHGAIPLKYIHHVYESRLDARALIHLRRRDGAPEVRKISLENGNITSTTRAVSARDFKSFSIFIECFTNYKIIWNTFFGEKHNDISVAMDLWLNRLVQWEMKHQFSAVINFALDRLQIILAKPCEKSPWTNFEMKAEYLDETTTKKAASTAGNKNTRQSGRLTCNSWNHRGSCTNSDCRFEHVCKHCFGDHTAAKCPKKDKPS